MDTAELWKNLVVMSDRAIPYPITAIQTDVKQSKG